MNKTIVYDMTPQEIDYIAGVASAVAKWHIENGSNFQSFHKLEELSDKLLFAEKELQK